MFGYMGTIIMETPSLPAMNVAVIVKSFSIYALRLHDRSISDVSFGCSRLLKIFCRNSCVYLLSKRVKSVHIRARNESLKRSAKLSMQLGFRWQHIILQVNDQNKKDGRKESPSRVEIVNLGHV
ncbi:hypothetical protein QVD17_29701 [Tagetes erecta]|uniref:Uncharacterized protein n=1 Tax=Tagetes erecta TaxID=13708 RepID=A0AAD8K031_TARER|nr:hypothetical protein QVD17_29701 [Tagetes erecta]